MKLSQVSGRSEAAINLLDVFGCQNTPVANGAPQRSDWCSKGNQVNAIADSRSPSSKAQNSSHQGFRRGISNEFFTRGNAMLFPSSSQGGSPPPGWVPLFRKLPFRLIGDVTMRVALGAEFEHRGGADPQNAPCLQMPPFLTNVYAGPRGRVGEPQLGQTPSSASGL